jgi:hypothetical protein
VGREKLFDAAFSILARLIFLQLSNQVTDFIARKL